MWIRQMQSSRERYLWQDRTNMVFSSSLVTIRPG